MKDEVTENGTLRSIASRRSVRSFSSKAVPREALDEMIRMASLAPSPLNNQPWRFVVIETRGTIEKIAEAVERSVLSIESRVHKHVAHEYRAYKENATFFRHAPVLVVVLLKPMDSDARAHHWGVPGFFENERNARGDVMCIGAACQNIMLAAESLGLGTCMMLYPLIANEAVRGLLDIRAPWHIMACIPVGYAGEPPSETPKRRAIKRIVQYI